MTVTSYLPHLTRDRLVIKGIRFVARGLLSECPFDLSRCSQVERDEGSRTHYPCGGLLRSDPNQTSSCGNV